MQVEVIFIISIIDVAKKMIQHMRKQTPELLAEPPLESKIIIISCLSIHYLLCGDDFTGLQRSKWRRENYFH